MIVRKAGQTVAQLLFMFFYKLCIKCRLKDDVFSLFCLTKQPQNKLYSIYNDVKQRQSHIWEARITSVWQSFAGLINKTIQYKFQLIILALRCILLYALYKALTLCCIQLLLQLTKEMITSLFLNLNCYNSGQIIHSKNQNQIFYSWIKCTLFTQLTYFIVDHTYAVKLYGLNPKL